MADFVPSEEIRLSGWATVGGLFSSRARAHPDQLAVVDGDRMSTFAQLDERSDLLANSLLQKGMKRGDRVAVLARNCLEYLEIELAAAKAGLIVAALNWRLGDRELTHCIALVEPKLIILQSEFKQVLDRLDLFDLPCMELGTEYEAQFTGHAVASIAETCGPEDGLVILYTSGTTGMPKGALVSHRAMIARTACFGSDLELPVGSNFVAWAPFYHMASTDQSLATLLRGGTVYVVDGYQPDQLIQIVENVTIGWFVLMPGMVGEFADLCAARNVKPKGIQVCGAMADLVPREHIAAATTALDAPYVNSFGATETGLPPATRGLIPIGEAPKSLSKLQCAFVEIMLVDPENNEVPQGQPGEVALRGPTLFSGYWNAHETNARDFRGGWFHMGDVMRRNVDGTLDYVDRVKYLIKSGGENIYPAEIEQVILTDDRVSEAVVVRKADDKWGEVPVVFIVANEHAVTADEITANCKNNLSSYKRPKEVYFIRDEDLPRSTTGKVQRHELEKRVG